MYYNPPRHLTKKRKKTVTPRYRRSLPRPYPETRPMPRSYPYRSSRRRPATHRRVTIRTHTALVLLFLLTLTLLGWYSGLIPLAIQKLASWSNTSAPIAGSHSIQGSPTITADKINSILCNAGSPACGDGQTLYNEGIAANINPAYPLAFFQHESSFGTTGEAIKTHSLGNSRCVPNVACVDQDRGGYAQFPTWADGFQAWYNLLNSNVYIGSGHTTLETIIPIYAPAADNNDEQAYINSVANAVQSWQQ